MCWGGGRPQSAGQGCAGGVWGGRPQSAGEGCACGRQATVGNRRMCWGGGGGRPQPAAEGSAAQGRPGLRHPRLESARPSPDRSQSRPLKVSGTSHVSPHLTPNKKAQGAVLLLLFSCSVVSSSFVIPWTAIHQAPLSMGFPRQGYWSGIFPTKRSNPGLLHWQADSLPLSP